MDNQTDRIHHQQTCFIRYVKNFFSKKENYIVQKLKLQKERKIIGERINKDKIKYLFFIFLINLKDNFKVIIVTIYWELVAYG